MGEVVSYEPGIPVYATPLISLQPWESGTERISHIATETNGQIANADDAGTKTSTLGIIWLFIHDQQEKNSLHDLMRENDQT